MPQGMGEKEVEDLFLRRKDNCLNPKEPSYMPYEEVNELFWETSADIFIPGAASRLLTTSHMKTLIEKAGVCVVSCGANIPFDEKETFYGKTTEWVDKRIALIPDFIANCGIARAFSFLMSSALEDKNPSDIRIFEDASQTIYRQLHAIRANTKQGKCLTEQVFFTFVGKKCPVMKLFCSKASKESGFCAYSFSYCGFCGRLFVYPAEAMIACLVRCFEYRIDDETR